MLNNLLWAALLWAPGAFAQTIPYTPVGDADLRPPSQDWTAFEDEAPGTRPPPSGAGQSLRELPDGHRHSFSRPAPARLSPRQSGRVAPAPRGRPHQPGGHPDQADQSRANLGPDFPGEGSPPGPLGPLPSIQENLHHYVAVVEDGEAYYTIRLSSTEDVYLDFRDAFIAFLNSFRPGDSR